MQTLAEGVLEAFGFDDPMHLYEFRFRDRLGRGRVYHHFETEQGPFVDDVDLAELNLPDGTEIAFRFDFGDSWRFEILLEKVEPTATGTKDVVLLHSVGKAPAQYPEWP